MRASDFVLSLQLLRIVEIRQSLPAIAPITGLPISMFGRCARCAQLPWRVGQGGLRTT